jgi:sulfite exporter TauE/SafE
MAHSQGLQAGLAGGLWVAWPCGLLQSALVVAGLANTPGTGAAVMAAFGLTSGAGLQLANVASSRWLQRRTGFPDARSLNRLVVRLAGACLALGSLWALGHDALRPILAYCFG